MTLDFDESAETSSFSDPSCLPMCAVGFCFVFLVRDFLLSSVLFLQCQFLDWSDNH